MNTEQIPPIVPQVVLKPEKKKGGKKKITLERLRIATEKLQLSRIKATLTLIALGFGVYKVYHTRIENGQQPLVEFFNGRDLGLVLLSIGFVMLAMATVQHTRSITRLKLLYKDMPVSVSLLLSYFILTLAVLLLVITFMRL